MLQVEHSTEVGGGQICPLNVWPYSTLVIGQNLQTYTSRYSMIPLRHKFQGCSFHLVSVGSYELFLYMHYSTMLSPICTVQLPKPEV